MGCVPSRNQRPKVIVLNPEQISRYPRQGKVVIKTKSPSGKLIGHSNCLFQLPEPIKLNSRGLEFLSGKFWVSSCILPGVDPRGECMKTCQDNCLFLSNGSSILLGLFDGHGSDGDKVSQFCCTFLKSFYTERVSLLQVIFM